MLDGRKSFLLGGALSLVVACGGNGGEDIGVRDVDPSESVEQPEPAAEPEADETPETSPAPEVPPVLGSCEGTNPPARCDADPQTFDAYGAAGVISYLELLGDDGCCDDFDGDGEPDNALGEGFANIDKLDQLNAELNASLVTGSQTILLELVGVDNAQNDDEVALHVFGGARVDSSPTSGPEVALDPSTIDRGVEPLFTFDSAKIVDGVLVATQGSLKLEASFNGVLLKPAVHDVRVRAQIDQLGEGLTLREGEVAGRLELRQIDYEINAVAGDCACLGLRGPLVTDGVCETPDTTACEAEGSETCAAVAEVCPVLEIIASNIADVDADADGVNESISLGAVFEADAARITGVMR